MICVKDEHLEKQDFPNDVTDDGIVKCVIELHKYEIQNPFALFDLGNRNSIFVGKKK